MPALNQIVRMSLWGGGSGAFLYFLSTNLGKFTALVLGYVLLVAVLVGLVLTFLGFKGIHQASGEFEEIGGGAILVLAVTAFIVYHLLILVKGV